MKIMPNRLDRGFYMYQKEFEDKALEVLRSGWYVLGNEVKSFEEEWAAYTGQNTVWDWPADWMRCGWRSAFWASEQETK